ncbi:MAG: ankyrin repeat domain-containing protein [Bryobacteraceae bacterium]
MRYALLGILASVPAWCGGLLLDAARGDDAAAVKVLIRGGADANEAGEDGTTALAWAANRCNAAIAGTLLAAGADPDRTSEMGIGPLWLSITNGCEGMPATLLAAGANPNVARENGESPLMVAARLGQVAVMEALIARGADVNARDKKFGQTALMWAARKPAAVRLLLAHGADAKALTSEWEVKYTVYAPTTVTLGKTGIPWNTDGAFVGRAGGRSALFFAVQAHERESARMLIEAAADVNAADAGGTTPLLAALYNWDPPEVTFIPGKGAPAPAGSSQRFRPDLAMAELLIERGAKPGGADAAGYTALHGAALAVADAALGPEFRRGGAYGNKAALLSMGRAASEASELPAALGIVEKLLAAGADPNRQTVFPTPGPAGDVRINPAPPGSSAYHIAAASRSLELVRMLSASGADSNLLRKDGHTPFSVAVMAGDVEVAKYMLEHGADLEKIYDPTEKIPDPVEPITVTRQKQTIMHIAALSGSPAMVTFLRSKGARMDLRNSAGETPLDLADHQERYREAIMKQAAEGDAEKVAKVVRPTEMTAAFRAAIGR